MDIGTMGSFAVALLALLMAILFGSQSRGVVPWLRNRRAKPRATPGDGVRSSPALEVAQTSQAPQPASATVDAQPPHVTISQVLAAKGRLRAARWSTALPVLFYACGMLTLFVGWLILLLSTFVGGLGSPLSLLSNTILYVAIFLMVLAYLSPLIVALLVLVWESLRALKG